MPVRRRYFKKKPTYRKKAYGKKRMYKRARKAYLKPDGAVSEKFVFTQDVLCAGAGGNT